MFMNNIFKNEEAKQLFSMAKAISPRLSMPVIGAIANGINRFGQLAEVYPMSSRTLAKVLTNLEKEQILTKNEDQSYSLTKKGAELAIHIKGVGEWAKRYY
jgi:DNA-binding HxlR family transcriptional regulator